MCAEHLKSAGGVKPGPLIARGAVAAALATLVTPAAALLALISPSEGEANQCRAILAQMKKQRLVRWLPLTLTLSLKGRGDRSSEHQMMGR
jgi:hypothetical protein